MDEEVARRRVKRLSTIELLNWTESALAGTLRYVEAYRRTGDEANLAETSLHFSVIKISIEELILRKEAENEDH